MSSQTPERETLGKLLRSGRDRLQAAGIDDASLEAELLMRQALRGPDRPLPTKAWLLPRLGQTTTEAQRSRFEALLTRRLAHEPSAYITGVRQFFALDFEVTPAVLIPRPETELLVDRALAHLRGASWQPWPDPHPNSLPLAEGAPSPSSTPEEGPSTSSGSPLSSQGEGPGVRSGAPLSSQGEGPGVRSSPRLSSIADIGTGSGAIAVSLARHLPGATVIATDASWQALAVAKRNARRHGVDRRISLRHGDLLVPLDGYVDMIVANLPYVRDDDWRELAHEVRDREPRLALAGGADGLDLIRALIDQAPRYLRPGGALCLEFGIGQKQSLEQAVHDRMPAADVEVFDDFAGSPRVLLATLRPR